MAQWLMSFGSDAREVNTEGRERYGDLWYGSYRSPALLHVNREAREVALQSYKLIFQKGNFVYPIYIDPSKDTIQLQSMSDFWAMLSSSAWGPDDREDFKKNKFLSLSDEITRRWREKMSPGYYSPTFGLSHIFSEMVKLWGIITDIKEVDLLCDNKSSKDASKNMNGSNQLEEATLRGLFRKQTHGIEARAEQPKQPLIRFLKWKQMKEYRMSRYQEAEERLALRSRDLLWKTLVDPKILSHQLDSGDGYDSFRFSQPHETALISSKQGARSKGPFHATRLEA
jgi:hypothetical protein